MSAKEKFVEFTKNPKVQDFVSGVAQGVATVIVISLVAHTVRAIVETRLEKFNSETEATEVSAE